MIPVGDRVGAKWRRTHFDAVFINRIDPVATLLDEPLDRFALCRPTLVRGNVAAFVCTFDAIREVQERKVQQRWETEHGAEAPLPTSVTADLAVVDDQACARHRDQLAHIARRYRDLRQPCRRNG